MSIKKMQKGGSLWIKGKGVFGFLVDGKAKTASIPNIKSEDIVAEIRIILKKKRVKIKQYRRIIRKLRHLGIILPGTKFLFPPINKVLEGGHQIIGLGNSIKV